MAAKSKRGGARPGAGRKPSNPPIDAALLAMSVEQVMELAVRIAAARGRWDDASKAGKRLLDARARQASPQGKKQQRQDAAEGHAATGSRFAPPPPPGSALKN